MLLFSSPANKGVNSHALRPIRTGKVYWFHQIYNVPGETNNNTHLRRNIPSSKLISYRLLMGSFVPVLFNEVNYVFLGPITLIRNYVSISRSEVNSWVTSNIEVLIPDIICSSILQRRMKKPMDHKSSQKVEGNSAYMI